MAKIGVVVNLYIDSQDVCPAYSKRSNALNGHIV